MTDGRNFFVQPVKNNLITYDKIRKIAIGQGKNLKNSKISKKLS